MGTTDELAMARMAAAASQPTFGEEAEARRIQAGIDDAMRGVIADAVGGRMYRPFREPSAGTVVPAGAVRVVDAPSGPRGWVEPTPLGPPPGVAAIDRIVEAHLGPASPKPSRRITTAELIAETRARLSDLEAQLAAEGKKAMEEKLEREEAEKAKVEPPEE
jgi:hypothetical protein